MLNRNQFTKPTVQGILSLSSVRGNVICSEPCSGCMSIIMIVPPCRPLPRRLAAVSFLFVFSVDHPLCRLAIVAITSLPGFHQSEREGRLGVRPCPPCTSRRGNEGGGPSVCVLWFKPEGSRLLFWFTLTLVWTLHASVVLIEFDLSSLTIAHHNSYLLDMYVPCSSSICVLGF